jgi:hypothetical protein
MVQFFCKVVQLNIVESSRSTEGLSTNGEETLQSMSNNLRGILRE